MSKNVYIDYNIYHTYIAYADISLRKTLLQGICSVHTISCFYKHKKMRKLYMLQGVQISTDITYNYFYAAKPVISKSYYFFRNGLAVFLNCHKH